ncbi:MAG: alternative ribosome rescue aminoacyl-tRNA hydrolase ArfB [Planctomycetota bacterium]
MPEQTPSSNQDDAAGRVRLGPRVFVPESALTMRAVRSSGPGGQNVNRRSTKVELRIAVDDIPLMPAASARLRRLAGSRLAESGEIILTSDEHRTQKRNREACLERLRTLVIRALERPKPRIATKPSRGAVQRRLDEKKQRGQRKRDRGWRPD